MAAGAEIHVPAICPLDVANALLVLVRRNKLTAAERNDALASLRHLSLKIDPEAAALASSELTTLASDHQLSIYDACYLELAVRKRLPLACKDGPLRTAAKRCRVKMA